MSHNVSRAMSTQHPDNVTPPFFADSAVMAGEDEIREAFYVYSHLGCREQLWDCEGKQVDNFVVKKLLTKYSDYFSKKKLGRENILSLRVPNPREEKAEAKILLEVLHSIPRSYDAAKLFYGEDIAPVFEVFVPMVTGSMDVARVRQYYHKYVSGRQNDRLFPHDKKISEWIGNFGPEDIMVTPLIEDRDSMLKADRIVGEYLGKFPLQEYQRVWLARSDPALNYGSVPTVIYEKIALQRIHQMEDVLSTELLPMLGCGSAPFRGNFKPQNVRENIKAYPSVQTFTLQSSFKYDHPERDVLDAVDCLNSTKRGKPLQVEEPKCLAIADRLAKQYGKEIAALADMVNALQGSVPSRRMRKLHVGLFGYSRAKEGITLPRAIKFTGSLYSAGLPPELLGLSVMEERDKDRIADIYPSFEQDINDAIKYLNMDNLKYFPNGIRKSMERVCELFPCEFEDGHNCITTAIMKGFSKSGKALQDDVTRAAHLRGFLG